MSGYIWLVQNEGEQICNKIRQNHFTDLHKLTYKNHSKTILLAEDLFFSGSELTGHIYSLEWRSGLPYDPKRHNISKWHQMAEEHQWQCPHLERWCCHSVPSLYCPPDDMEQQNKCWQKLLFILTGHIIRYTMDEIEPVCLQKCFNPSGNSFNKGLETILIDFGLIVSCSFCRVARLWWEWDVVTVGATGSWQRLGLNRQYKAGWSCDFMPFPANSDAPIWMLKLKSGLVRSGNISCLILCSGMVFCLPWL